MEVAPCELDGSGGVAVGAGRLSCEPSREAANAVVLGREERRTPLDAAVTRCEPGCLGSFVAERKAGARKIGAH